MMGAPQSVPTAAMVASAVAAQLFPCHIVPWAAMFSRASVRARGVAAVVLPPCALAIDLPGDAPERSQRRRVFLQEGRMI